MRLHALAVERAAARGAARGQAHRDRARHAGPIEMRGRLVDDLVEGDRREVGELHFDDRPHALDGGAHGAADHGVFADRAVEHAAREIPARPLVALNAPPKVPMSWP